MPLFKEKRLYERYDHTSDIVYACAGKPGFNNARMFNSSEGGIFFNSKYELIRGSLVSIKLNRLCSVSYAHVMRCDPINGGEAPCYGIGIKFIEV